MRFFCILTGIFVGLCLGLHAPALADDTPTAPPPIVSLDPATTTAVRTGDKLTITIKNPSTGVITSSVYDLELVPRGKNFFHWTTEGTPDRWMKQGGKILPDEMAWLASPNTGMQAFGPGWYVSSNPIDSHSFGVSGAEETIPQDFWVINHCNIFRPNDAATAQQAEAILGKLGIIGTKANDTWYTIFDSRAAENLHLLNGSRALDALMSKDYILPTNGTASLDAISSVTDLEPHPFFAKYFPEVENLLEGKTLAPTELDKIVKDNYPYLTADSIVQRDLYLKIAPAQRMDLLQRIAPPSDPTYMQSLLIFDQFGELPPASDLAKLYPEVGKLISGEKLSDAEHAAMSKLIIDSGSLSQAVKQNTTLTNRIRQEFQQEIQNYYVAQIAAGGGVMSDVYETAIYNARSWGVPLSLIDQKAKDPGLLLSDKPLLSFQEARGALSEKGRNILDSFAFINEANLITALANGNTTPWTLYDKAGSSPFLASWSAAKAKKSFEFADLFAKLEGVPASYRDSPLFKSMRVSEKQLNVLLNNPFLTVHYKIDPKPTSQAERSFLVQYEYPDATTYKKFASFLSPELLGDLKSAEATESLRDPANAIYKTLTSRISLDLLMTADNCSTPLEQFVRRMSVHAFISDNDRFARLMYMKANDSSPLLLRDWSDALLSTPSELIALRDEGNRQLAAIANAFRQAEVQNPANPDYSNIPELYNGFFRSPEPIGNPADYEKLESTFFHDSTNQSLIASKQFPELEAKAWDTSIDSLFQQPADAQKKLLLDWVSAGLVPTPTTSARLQAVLDASSSLVGDADNVTILRWWFELSREKNASYAKIIASFIEKLPPSLRQAYQLMWLNSGGAATIPFTPGFMEEERALARTSFQNSTDIPTKTKAAVFLLQDMLANPVDPKFPTAGVMKALTAYLKDPSGSAITTALMQLFDESERARFLAIFLELPPGTLDNTNRKTVLQGLLMLNSSDRNKLLAVALQHPEHWMVTDAWKLVSENTGYTRGEGALPLNEVLDDPKIFAALKARMLRDPANSKMWSGIISSLSGNSATRQAEMYTFLGKKKSWKMLTSLLKENYSNMVDLAGDDSNKVLTDSISEQLQKMIASEPKQAAIGYLFASQLGNKDTALAELFKALPMSAPENNRFIVQSIMAMILSQNYAPTTSKVINTYDEPLLSTFFQAVASSGSDTMNIFLTQLKPGFLEAVKNDSALGESLATLLWKLDNTTRETLIRRLARLHSPLGNSLLSGILASGDAHNTQMLAKLISDPAFDGPRWLILQEASASADPATRKLFVSAALNAAKEISVDDPGTERIAQLIQSISKNGAGSLTSSEFADIPIAVRIVIQNEFNSSLAHKMRVDVLKPLGAAAALISCPESFSALKP